MPCQITCIRQQMLSCFQAWKRRGGVQIKSGTPRFSAGKPKCGNPNTTDGNPWIVQTCLRGKRHKLPEYHGWKSVDAPDVKSGVSRELPRASQAEAEAPQR
jgi:hypothetical protein